WHNRGVEAMREERERRVDFRPARWLPSPHLQTVWGGLARPRARIPFRREALETPDGDELLLDPAGEEHGPRALILHRLEGCSASVYVQGLAGELLARGLAVTA